MWRRKGESQLTYAERTNGCHPFKYKEAVDFVVTGCGRCRGYALFKQLPWCVVCGLAVDPTDAYLYSQINGGNALSIPYAKICGWGAELTLKLMWTLLYAEEMRGDYPRTCNPWTTQRSRILNEVKQITHNVDDHP